MRTKRRSSLASRKELELQQDIINYYELMWHFNKTIPTIEDVAKRLKVTHIEVNYWLAKSSTQRALTQRGIDWRSHTQTRITPSQQAAALTVMNFADERPIAEKLDELGIEPATYYAWLNKPHFKNFVDQLASNNVQNIRPAAITELTKKINRGNWSALKYYLDATGELRQQDAPQGEVLIKMIVEIIQKHVKDPETIVAIAQDIKLAAANKTLEDATAPAIEAPPIVDSVTVDEEKYEEAQKMLGFA